MGNRKGKEMNANSIKQSQTLLEEFMTEGKNWQREDLLFWAGRAAILMRDISKEKALPEGWVMLPKEYTPEMRVAYNNACKHGYGGEEAWLVKDAWKAFIEAAPKVI